MKGKKLPPFLIVIWGLNLLGLIGVFVFFWMKNPFRAPPVRASVDEAVTGISTSPAVLASPFAPLSVDEAVTSAPTAYLLPTVTPNPRSTPVVGTSPPPWT